MHLIVITIQLLDPAAVVGWWGLTFYLFCSDLHREAVIPGIFPCQFFSPPPADECWPLSCLPLVSLMQAILFGRVGLFQLDTASPIAA